VQLQDVNSFDNRSPDCLSPTKRSHFVAPWG